jgi:hypothetical protein
MVDEKPKKKKTATPLESNQQKSDAWWVDADYPDRIPPIVLNEP